MHSIDEKNHWGSFIIFIAILFFLVELLNYIPRQTSHRKNGNFWPFFYKEIPENSLDIIYMGNSHSKTTFIPEIIDNLLGTKSTHVNTSGESIYQTIYEYKEVLHYQKSGLVVLETFPIYDGHTRDNLKPWNFSFFYSMPLSLRKIIYSYQFFSDSDLLNFSLPFTSNHANWKKPDVLYANLKDEVKELIEKRKTGWHVDLPHQGYENYLKSLPPEQEQTRTTAEDPDCPISDFKERLSVTEDILEISRKRENDIVLIEAPQYNNSYEKCRTEVADLAKQYDVPFQISLEGGYFSPLWFADDQHMTQFGAIIASVEAARFLGDELNIPLNQGKLAYYQSYYFLDYTLIQKGNTVTLTLIPENYENIKDVGFKWNVSLNDEIFFDYEDKGNNKFSFSLPEPTGEYFIRVVIHNPVSNYYLRGGFPLVIE